MRRQAELKARQEREQALREETRRLERAAEDDRRRRRRTKERMREVEARELYEMRWKSLLAPPSVDSVEDGTLRFHEIPWPVMACFSKSDLPALHIGDITAEAISSFLLPPSERDGELDGDAPKKDRREKLRETMLRFHPDKFEGRIMKRVRDSDRELVKEAVGIVARTINALMGEAK